MKYPQTFQAHGLRRGDVFSDGRVVRSKSSWYHVSGETWHTIGFADGSHVALPSGDLVTVLGKDYAALEGRREAVAS